MLAALRKPTVSLKSFTAELTLYPQILVNVRTATKIDFAGNAGVQRAVADAEAKLAGQGRVLLRASGTEPVIRVMVEGEDHALVSALANTVADAVRAAA